MAGQFSPDAGHEPSNENNSPAPQAGPSRWRVRTYLFWLVIVSLLPGIIGAAALLSYQFQQGRTQQQKDTLQTARALSQAVDNLIQKVEVLSHSLATAGSLGQGDLASFHKQAQETLKRAKLVANVVLIDKTGRQVMNTLKEFGEPLPFNNNPTPISRVFESGQPVISNLYIGAVTRRLIMTVYVPVVINGQTAYVLVAPITPEKFKTILDAQGLPQSWVASILDGTGTIAASTTAAEEFVGKQSSQDFRQRFLAANEGSMEGRSADRSPIVTVFARSPVTNWGVSIEIPRQVLETPLVHSLLALALGMATLFAISLGVAQLLGRRLSRSFRALVAPALALGEGKEVHLQPMEVMEAAELATAIEKASDLLQQRTTAQKQAEAIVRQLNADLERRVEERTAELVAANRELEGFTFATSHDLRGPLGRINSFTTLLERAARDRLEGDSLLFLDIIRQNASRLMQLVDDLLNHARVAQQTLELQCIDIADAVQSTVRDKMQETVELKGEIRVNLPPVNVLADAHALGQALGNLVENAIKYSSTVPSPLIEVGGEQAGDRFRLWVRDNGIGFKMEYHDNIFQIFQRLHTYTEYTGSGVGLALVKRAVERMGGKVWAESEPGQGTTFFLELQAAT